MSDGSRLKACRDCQQVFPETAQYFYTEQLKGGVYYKPQCKACHREKSAAQSRARYAKGHRPPSRTPKPKPPQAPKPPKAKTPLPVPPSIEYPPVVEGATWVVLGSRSAEKRFALVDDADAQRVTERKWKLRSARNLHYADSKNPGGRSSCAMHRFILDAPAGSIVDHINGDGLDNRRSNLRFATHAENMRNRRHGVGGSSAYKGVSKRTRSAGWIAQITFNKKRIYCGTYVSEEEAARAYDAKAKELFGEYARLNFPE